MKIYSLSVTLKPDEFLKPPQEMIKISFKQLPILLSLFTILLSIPLTVFLTIKAAPARALVQAVIPQDDLLITQDTVLAPGNYQINDVNRNGVIIIKADNVTLNCNGATINGSNYTGFGIYNNGFHNLTIKNCNIGKYYYALRSENGNSFVIQNNNLSGNRLIPDGNFFVNINQGPEITDSAYLGGGIYLRNSSGSNIVGNTLTNQQNGIDFYSVTNTTVTSNNASDNAGWGIHLYASTSNTISGNTADRVTRNCYGRPGCDSAGFLLAWNSHSNQITNNSFQHGAEGFFIGNENGFPSNNNIISNNNGSYSAHNAFETTFSENNTFIGNTASNSNYGFWLGYSSNSKIEGNTIESNRTDGIAIEHGHNNILTNNTIKNNKQVGINLWTDYNDFLLRKYPANRYSYGYTINNNTLTANGKNIVFMGTTNSLIKDNILSDSGISLYLRQANINGELVNSQENAIESNDLFCTPPPQVNLALGKTTNANVSPQTSQKAVDGDKIGGLNVPHVTSYTWNPGTLNPGDWWQVDLGEPKTIQTIVIYPYVNNYHDWLDKFHIVASNTGQFAGEETTILTVTDFPNNPFNIYTISPIQTRYLRIIADEQRNWIQLQEFETYQEANITIYNCQYHFYNYQPADVIAKYNWWSTTDTAKINTRIYDKNDNSTLGAVSYEPFLTDSFKKQSKLIAKIKFQGVRVQRGDKQVRITLKNGQVFENVTVTSDSQGVYSGLVGNITPGTYEVLAKGPSHLQKNFGSVTFVAGQTTTKDWSNFYLLAGDFNGDNLLTIEDLGLILSAYTQLSVPIPPGNPIYDINFDNIISIEDIALPLANYTDFCIPGDDTVCPGR